MGVPAFYRWITRRYPLIVVDAAGEEDFASADLSQPSPNGFEFDHLYLDMNGIVHTCFHPEGKAAPSTYDEVFQCIFHYIDRLVAIVRPRKLLYLAIDGVAPRAKMNQQRSRRFRAAKDTAETADSKPSAETSDSNVITPGTEFMACLSDALNHYVQLRLSQNLQWTKIKVILSDANVPGEGEHKIMSFIRSQRNLPGYDPNTRHCLYGLDADLIMLALATHELHFSIMREIVDPRKCHLCGEIGHIAIHCDGPQKRTVAETHDVRYQFLQVWLLREYLELDLHIPDCPSKLDFERLIDDFVFICFFVGNDFLPSLPTLDIRQGAVSTLLAVYKREFCNMKDYLTDNGEVNLKSLEHFFRMVGLTEENFFQKCSFKKTLSGTSPDSSSSKSDFKRVYYSEKFGVENTERLDELRNDLALKYTEGLCWTLHYYYRGVSSWQWFYPYHYAPFASDLSSVGALEIGFKIGKPLKPFDQLMGVLPAASARAVPECYRSLMTNPASPIIDFYPDDFEIDLNGKRFAWQGVAKLPFIDLERLLEETEKLEGTLSQSEAERNTTAQDLLFLSSHHPLAIYIYAGVEDFSGVCKLNPSISEGMNGFFTWNRDNMEIALANNVLCVKYIPLPDQHHIPRPPDGVAFPAKSITDRDFRRSHQRSSRRRSTSTGSSDAFQDEDYHQTGQAFGRRRRSRSSSKGKYVDASQAALEENPVL